MKLAGAIRIFHFETTDIVLHQQRYATEVRVCADPGEIAIFEGFRWYAARKSTKATVTPEAKGHNKTLGNVADAIDCPGLCGILEKNLLGG